MLRLNKLTDYAVVILAQMSRNQEARHSSASLAAQIAVPEPTVAKILKDLVKSGLVQSYRGATGGYILARAGDAITIRDVIEAVEGPITVVECIEKQSVCCVTEKQCPLRGRWDMVNDAVIRSLDGITLRDMIGVPPVHINAAE